MNKQTYEEVAKALNSVMDDTCTQIEVGKPLQIIKKFIESQKPLEIVEGGVYIAIQDITILKGNDYIEGFLLTEGDEIKIISISKWWIVIECEECFKKYYCKIFKNQFNQHNFMKVEDK